MYRIARPFGALLFVLAVVAAPVAGQDSVAGKWTIVMNSPEVGSVETHFDFAQDGSEVSGTADVAIVEAAEISDGLYEDGVLSFLLHVSMEGQWFTVEIEADVDGDEMSGEAYIPEMGQGMPFTGKRTDG